MGEIAEGAVMPITQKSWPKTCAAWGDAGIERINSLMQPAAEILASSPGCDRLEILSLSEIRSSPPDTIVFYADCANGKRFYISEEDIIAKRKIVSQNDKSKWLDDLQMIEISHGAVSAKIGHPCQFFEASVYRAVVGRTVVAVEFSETKNDGVISKRVAKCFFDGISLKEVELQ